MCVCVCAQHFISVCVCAKLYAYFSYKKSKYSIFSQTYLYTLFCVTSKLIYNSKIQEQLNCSESNDIFFIK